jgi:Ca2+-transporting ATPase
MQPTNDHPYADKPRDDAEEPPVQLGDEQVLPSRTASGLTTRYHTSVRPTMARSPRSSLDAERAPYHEGDPTAEAVPPYGRDGGEKAAAVVVAIPNEQPFVQYDEEALAQLIERRDTVGLNERFGGVEGLRDTFQSDFAQGLMISTIRQREAQWGRNVLPRKPPKTFLFFLKDALSDRIMVVLLIAAVVSIVFGLTLPNTYTGRVERTTGWIDGTVIVLTVALITLVTSINNYSKEKQFAALAQKQSEKTVQVVRDGADHSIPADALQVGDMVKLETGMELTCDYVVVRADSLKTNESAITGEPDLVEKNPDTEAFVISGTFVEEGQGLAMVVAIGMRSYQGRLKGQLDADASDTPLQIKLARFAKMVTMAALISSFLLLIALIIKEVIIVTTRDESDWSVARFLSFVLVCVALIVVVVPMGLPLAVTITFAYAMRAMMKEHCLVRILASCETMGAVTTICSDKTGTLTKNEMTVVQGLIAETEFVIAGYGIEPRTEDVAILRADYIDQDLKLNDNVRFLVSQAIAVNSTAEEVARDGDIVWSGNKTEMGMLKFVALIGSDYKAVRSANGDRRTYPFSSAKKSMTTIVREQYTDPRQQRAAGGTLFAKGASERILELCTHRYNAAGEIVPLDSETRVVYEEIIIDMAKQGNRTIGVACSVETIPLGDEGFPSDDPIDVHPLAWIGVLGIQDPMREEVPEAVRLCQSAGVTVRMVTGDNIYTACSIASKCGFYDPRDENCVSMGGPTFRQMAEENPERLKVLLPRLRVLARSSPTDKHILVGLLKELGDVVAVTGDGTNDAPALKLANVGFAMNSGTDIAKGAAEMILVDDNFATVVTATKWGRTVNDNIAKFMQFKFPINVAGMILTIVGALASDESKAPFTPMQLLWLNLIVDPLAAIAIATELPTKAALRRKPTYQHSPLITRRMRVFISFHAATQLLILLLVIFLGHRWFKTIDEPERCSNPVDDEALEYCAGVCADVGGTMDGKYCRQGRVHSTMIFNTFMWMQIFNLINARKVHGERNPFEGLFRRSRAFLVVLVVISALQAIFVELGGHPLQVTHLSGTKWVICVGLGAIELLVGVVQRAVPVTNREDDSAYVSDVAAPSSAPTAVKS